MMGYDDYKEIYIYSTNSLKPNPSLIYAFRDKLNSSLFDYYFLQYMGMKLNIKEAYERARKNAIDFG